MNVLFEFYNGKKLKEKTWNVMFYVYLNICRAIPFIFKLFKHPVNPCPPGMLFINPNGAWGAPPKCNHVLSINFLSFELWLLSD